MTITNPTQLIDEFKKSGEFDRLRRDLLSHFQRSERTEAFKSRVDDIARQRLSSDPKLISMPNDAIQRELLGEIDRYPIVERAVVDAPLLSDPSFIAGIRASLERTMSAGRSEEKNNATPSQSTPNLQPCDSGNPNFNAAIPQLNDALTPSAVQKE
ncbi:uncharacterized protein F5891DRAFT_991539 [Suillus fuscotomentosus]|uniref:BOD1/SHG1 domain-containing protein n=1 Tax=Suillus fuscotomentosus TaxID=1912939 RepID=A0AAD4EJS8_9AGAM|nr:uncharacterized protein F5891DRAFT_1002043 [Suillus fuscotomentosus]XP_041233686.1 uncharacterized protein F5891DRAFT_991539 [Suillus fuscotomentosus]KAG1907508.1 hypothetical protein F5891DRAFT_1002043 [Suillus fuscotomentosus]KAG1908111.1 hypothetical protein F5891DRAFT_991539 [Suillus fuscotomentosus]